MPTVLVTVQGPQRTLDLEVPGDTPISQLFPLLHMASATSPVGNAPGPVQHWALGPIRGTPLPSDRTLIDCGIVDGCVLLFQEAGAWTEHWSAATPEFAVPTEPESTGSDTGGIGIRWNKEDLLS